MSINRVYAKVRGLPPGTELQLSTSELSAMLWSRGVWLARGAVRGRWLFLAGPNFRVKGAKLTAGRFVTVGPDVIIDSISKSGVTLGDRVTIDRGALLRGSGVYRNLGEGIKIGDRSAVGAYNVILGQGGVEIGRDCLIGPHVTIVSENHVISDPHVPIREQGEERRRTVIGDDVWIGAGATILAGAVVGSGVVVAAGSVVRGSIEPNVIVAGTPARVLRRRGDSE
ncbi:acyltransferase [Nocardia sp. N13]|uniref:acyltransferase n=1 Tax=Nocardioides sp. N13(2025) TaxID=3453405 RepID=UPI003F77024F